MDFSVCLQLPAPLTIESAVIIDNNFITFQVPELSSGGNMMMLFFNDSIFDAFNDAYVYVMGWVDYPEWESSFYLDDAHQGYRNIHIDQNPLWFYGNWNDAEDEV